MLVGERVILRTVRPAIFDQGRSQDLCLYSIVREEAPSLKDILASED